MTLLADDSQDHLIASVTVANPNSIDDNTTAVPAELLIAGERFSSFASLVY